MSSLYSSANLAHFESTAPLKSLLMLRIFSEVSPLWPYVNSRNCSPYNSSVIVSLEVFLDHLYEVLPCTYSDWYSSKNSRGLLCIFLALFFFGLAPPHNFQLPWPFWIAVSVSSTQRLTGYVWIPPHPCTIVQGLIPGQKLG